MNDSEKVNVKFPYSTRKDIPGRFNELSVLEHQWLRIQGLLQGEILPPYEVIIHPSSSCNIRCQWCIGDHVPSIDYKTLRVLEASKTNNYRLPNTLSNVDSMTRLIEGIVNYRKSAIIKTQDGPCNHNFSVEAVTFSGLIGEPLTSKHAVLNAMEILHNRGLRTGIFTNGILMDDEVRKTLLKIDYVHVSIDAATPETYTKLKFQNRPGGDLMFKRALSNLYKLSCARKLQQSTNLEINASFILYPDNCHELYEAAKLLKNFGVHFLRIKQDNSGSRPLNAEDIKKVRNQLNLIKQEIEDDNFRVILIHRALDRTDIERKFNRCTITDLMAAVGSDGMLYPCNYHPRPNGVSYGNAVEIPFGEVWESSQRAMLKKNLPFVCPKTCDPFKNRANTLLASLVNLRNNEGHSEMLNARDKLLAEWRQPEIIPKG